MQSQAGEGGSAEGAAAAHQASGLRWSVMRVPRSRAAAGSSRTWGGAACAACRACAARSALPGAAAVNGRADRLRLPPSSFPLPPDVSAHRQGGSAPRQRQWAGPAQTRARGQRRHERARATAPCSGPGGGSKCPSPSPSQHRERKSDIFLKIINILGKNDIF